MSRAGERSCPWARRKREALQGARRFSRRPGEQNGTERPAKGNAKAFRRRSVAPLAIADRRFAASTGSCSRVALIKAAERRKASRQRFVGRAPALSPRRQLLSAGNRGADAVVVTEAVCQPSEFLQIRAGRCRGSATAKNRGDSKGATALPARGGVWYNFPRGSVSRENANEFLPDKLPFGAAKVSAKEK